MPKCFLYCELRVAATFAADTQEKLVEPSIGILAHRPHAAPDRAFVQQPEFPIKYAIMTYLPVVCHMDSRRLRLISDRHTFELHARGLLYRIYGDGRLHESQRRPPRSVLTYGYCLGLSHALCRVQMARILGQKTPSASC